jgi:hypothetical protein
MPGLYEALAGFLQPGGRRPESGRTQAVEASLPVRESVVNLRGPGGIVGVLEGWRSAMQEHRGWGEPVLEGDIARRVMVAARALSINLDWIAACWDVAGQLAGVVRQLVREATAVVDPDDPDELRIRRGEPIGQCVAGLGGEDVCGAELRSYPGQAAVACGWCGTVYQPRDYLMLKQLQPNAA